MRSKPPSVRDRLTSELILCGGEVLTRGEAVQMLQREGVHRGAIDWCVFAVKPLSEEELIGFARNGLVLQLRLRCMSARKAREGR